MFNFLGNSASLIGLVFSILAFVFAKSASAAAREARDAVMRQSLSEDMSSAARIAGEVVMYLRTERSEMALLRIGDLMRQASYLVARWEARLPKKSKDNLARAREQLRPMEAVLTKRGAGLDPQEKAQLSLDAQRVSEIFNEEYGVAVKAAETRDD